MKTERTDTCYKCGRHIAPPEFTHVHMDIEATQITDRKTPILVKPLRDYIHFYCAECVPKNED